MQALENAVCQTGQPDTVDTAGCQVGRVDSVDATLVSPSESNVADASLDTSAGPAPPASPATQRDDLSLWTVDPTWKPHDLGAAPRLQRI